MMGKTREKSTTNEVTGKANGGGTKGGYRYSCIDGDDPILKQVKSLKEMFSLELKRSGSEVKQIKLRTR